MNATISIIFVLSLCASVGAQASARQRDEQIRKACAPREYVTSVQDYVKAQKQLSEARPGEIALETLLNRKSSEKQVASGCQQAVVLSAGATLPGGYRRCSPQQWKKLIADNSAAKWPQALRNDCWNF
jgi:hypothetical protein